MRGLALCLMIAAGPAREPASLPARVPGVERSEPPEFHLRGLAARSSRLDPSHPRNLVKNQ